MSKEITFEDLKAKLRVMVDKAGLQAGLGKEILFGEQLQAKLHLEYVMGQTVAYEQLAHDFKVKAGEAFANRQDMMAKVYRELEDLFTARGKEFRAIYQAELALYEKEYPND